MFAPALVPAFSGACLEAVGHLSSEGAGPGVSINFPVTLIPLTWAFLGFVVFRILAAPYHANEVVWYGAQVLGAVAGFSICAAFLKSRITRVRGAPFDVVQVSAEQFPGADTVSLTAQTESLKGLGFQILLDYTPGRSISLPATGYARLLFHPAHRCYAEINQVFSPLTGMGPLGTTVTTNFADGWSLYCGNRVASGRAAAILYANRLPRTLYLMLPGAPPTRLLERHLAVRDQITRDMPLLRVVSEPPLDAYFAEMKKRQATRAIAAKNRSILAWLVDVDSYAFRPRTVWLGDYAKRYPRSARAITAVHT
jgi:hypothetical protein